MLKMNVKLLTKKKDFFENNVLLEFASESRFNVFRSNKTIKIYWYFLKRTDILEFQPEISTYFGQTTSDSCESKLFREI